MAYTSRLTTCRGYSIAPFLSTSRLTTGLISGYGFVPVPIEIGHHRPRPHQLAALRLTDGVSMEHQTDLVYFFYNLL